MPIYYIILNFLYVDENGNRLHVDEAYFLKNCNNFLKYMQYLEAKQISGFLGRSRNRKQGWAGTLNPLALAP